MEENIKKPMEEVTEVDLMKEFMQLTDQPLKETELTASMFVEHMKVTRNKARYILNKYEEEGLLKSRQISVNRARTNAYSPTNGSWRDIVERMKNKE